MYNKVFLLLGSNIDDRLSYLRQACLNISGRIGEIAEMSSVYETESWGYRDNAYLNQVVSSNTKLNPRQLLDEIHAIESEMGRVRSGNGYQARTIDIDILYFNGGIVDEPDLLVPHKLLQDRRFVLVPLVELAPDFVHPVIKKTNKELLDCCPDKGIVNKYIIGQEQ